jgi:hypothetical protein
MALQQAGGNRKLAEQHLLSQLQQDPSLIYELTKPFLGGIVAHVITRSLQDKTAKTAQPIPKKPAPAPQYAPRRPTMSSMPTVNAASLRKKTPPRHLAAGGMDALVNALADKIGTGELPVAQQTSVKKSVTPSATAIMGTGMAPKKKEGKTAVSERHLKAMEILTGKKLT